MKLTKEFKRVSVILLTGISAMFFCNASATNQRSEVMIKKILAKETRDGDDADGVLRKFGKQNSEARKYYPVILEITNGEKAEEVLKELEAVVYYNRGTLYLTSIPTAKLDALPRDNRVDNFQLSYASEGCLDVARGVAGVDKVHEQLKMIEQIGQTGGHKVVTGMCDTGFDPRHKAFANSLKRWVIYDEYNGKRVEYDGYANILANAPLTDNETKTHATHVGNIIAGYQENAPYYGVAPASDFVATVSQMSNVGVCGGIEDVIAYAKETGRPAVVNISAGSYLGPHDGKDLVGRYLSELSKDAIICFSAGNYGQRLNCQVLDLDDYTDPVGSTWCDNSWNGFHVAGGTDMWSRDDTPFEFRLVVWDTDKKEYLMESEWMGGDNATGEFFLDLESTPWFTKGGVWVSWGTYAGNNRFNVAVEYDYESEAQQKSGPWANYCVAYHIRKVKANTHVDVYADGIYSFLHGKGFGVPWSLAGVSDGTISNLASCPDVLAVGAWNSRSVIPDVVMSEIDCGNATNRVADWSAYGTSGDGRKLPHFCAPGNMVVSALSTPHSMYAGPKDDADNVAAEIDGYKYFAARGTSMSSPMAAGIIALWQSVDADLSVDEAREIAMMTANRNFADISDPRWGAGAIDAYAGLEAIAEKKGNGGVGNVSVDDSSAPVIRIRDGVVDVVWPGAQDIDVAVYDMAGRRLANGGVPSNCPVLVEVRDVATGKRSVAIIKN